MRKAVLLGAVFLIGCGAKTSYTPDYVVKGKDFGWGELPQSFKPYTESVKWLEEKIKWVGMTKTFLPAEVSTENWDVAVEGSTLTATHLPTGRTYKIKLRIPFPMTHKGVVKEANGVLYVKEPLDGKVYILDPKKVEKEVGILRRAYLYDDGIAIVRGTGVRFCKDYNMSRCEYIYRIGEEGSIGRFFRINGAFVFYVEDYRWNEKKKGYRWLKSWFIYTPDGKKIAQIPHISITSGFYGPFWEEIDKQPVYARTDYYGNPYFNKGRPPIPYKNFTPPAVYVEGNRIYYFAHGQKAGSLKSITEARVIENGRVLFEKVKETNFSYASYGLGFCGEKVLVNFDGIWYDPDTKKKVKCSTSIRRLFTFGF